MQKGFTIVEVLIALFVVALGVGGLSALVRQTNSFAAVSSAQLQATFLAQEGVEIARNIRDSNFLAIHKGIGGNWDDGLTGCSGGCEADYNDTALGSFQDRFLKNDNGLYTYDSGTDTIFKRKIIVSSGGADILNVDAEVSWQERGRTHTVKSSTVLYNWLTPTP